MESNKKPRRNRVPLVLPLAHSTAHHEVPKKHNLSLAGSCRKKYHETSVARHERRSFQQRTTLSYNRPNSHDKACQTNTLLVNEIVRDKPGIEETTGIQNVIGELRDILETSSQNDCAENHLVSDSVVLSHSRIPVSKSLCIFFLIHQFFLQYQMCDIRIMTLISSMCANV